VADLLKRKFGVEAELVEGKKNEFSILVDNKVVAKKGWLIFPEDKKIITAVSRALEL
jgi:hypothetical protein